MSPDRRVSRPENSNVSALDSESEDEEEGEEEEWEVEKVLKKRKIGGETQYFVKWVGWEEVIIYYIYYISFCIHKFHALSSSREHGSLKKTLRDR